MWNICQWNCEGKKYEILINVEDIVLNPENCLPAPYLNENMLSCSVMKRERMKCTDHVKQMSVKLWRKNIEILMNV